MAWLSGRGSTQVLRLCVCEVSVLDEGMYNGADAYRLEEVRDSNREVESKLRRP